MVDKGYRLSVTPAELGPNADGPMEVRTQIQFPGHIIPAVISTEDDVIVATLVLVWCET